MSKISVRNKQLTAASARVINKVLDSDHLPQEAPKCTYWLGKVADKLQRLQKEYMDAIAKVLAVSEAKIAELRAEFVEKRKSTENIAGLEAEFQAKIEEVRAADIEAHREQLEALDEIENELPYERFSRADLEAARCIKPLEWGLIEFLVEPEEQ